jgi:hypothetical protein
MLRTLTIHPDSAGEAVTAIEVEAQRPGARALLLRFAVTAAPARLRLPPPAAPERTDELWRHTCFEAFLAAPGAAGYCELNLSPSGRWAGYRFDGYRRGMRATDGLAAPRTRLDVRPDGLELSAELDLGALTELPETASWRVGLSAVIEDADGQMSYWALAHRSGRPDFHHADCFAAELVAPQRA